MDSVLEKGEIKIKDVSIQKPKRNEALIMVLKEGISNTDLELVKGCMDFKGIPGHEFVGRVEHTSEKSLFIKRVVGEIKIACGKCEVCRTGNTRHCLRRDVLGIINRDGAFAEYLTLPLRNFHFLHQNISDTEAVLIEPLAAEQEIKDVKTSD